jgi:hypothetical protein
MSNDKNILGAEPAVFDRTSWGRIRLSGADRVRFLHNQTTNDIARLSAGQGGYTLFVTSTGRTIDLATAYTLPESLWLVVSPGMSQQLYDWMDRYIFFSDKVMLSDESEQTFLFTVLGTGADEVISSLGAGSLVGQREFTHQRVDFAGAALTVAVGSDLAIAGYSIWGDRAIASAVWQTILDAGAHPGDLAQWEQLRIQQGRPVPGKELTEDDNPLEAGLWQAVSFEKGCYIGQETIARLNTYKGVKKRLWGLLLDQPVAIGASIFPAESEDSSKIGKVTSVSDTASGILGLGYLRTKAGGEGLSVEIDGVRGKVVALPFVSHEYYQPDSAQPSVS